MSRKAKEEITSLRRITKKGLKELCKKNKLYQTPELNDVLYLHYQGFQDIECLEEYTGLKCLWLESNAISEIKGLENQTQLKCLFLHNNLIRKIENLESCTELDTLNLSNNHISRIENCGVDKLPVLTTLNLAHNYLKCTEDLQSLTECTKLSVLDLANNRIEDILIVKILAEMPELRVLVLTGNPVVSRIPQYRKTLTLECKQLTYLDSRPVFPRDRACAEAWKRGGYEEERREHDRWNKAERKKIRDSVNATLRLRNRGGGDPQVDLIRSSSDEDEGFTERTSAPLKEDLQNMSTKEVNAEIMRLMRLGDLVEYEQNEKPSKKSVNNEQVNEIEELKCNPCIANEAETLPDNKPASSNECAEDSTAEENTEVLARYEKIYKQAYDNYVEYVEILMNQDHSTNTPDQYKSNDATEFKAKNEDTCRNKIKLNENDDDNEISCPNLISTLNDNQTSSLIELTKGDNSNLELNQCSSGRGFTDIQNKNGASIVEFDSGKIDDVTGSEIELDQSEKVKNALPLEYSDSTNLQLAGEISSVTEEISITPIPLMESHFSVNFPINNLRFPSFIFPKAIEDNESQLAQVSDVESDKLEESPRKSQDDESKTDPRTIKDFISNYEQFLGTLDNRKPPEPKQTNSEKFDIADVENLSYTFVSADSQSSFTNLRFFMQNYPEVENEESRNLQIINRLLVNPITKRISNKNASMELDEQLKHVQDEKIEWIKKVTDKCYSQRERYNDDLEIKNDEVLIIKKDRDNASEEVGKEDVNVKLIKIEERLENDDSEVYEMPCFAREEIPIERIEKEKHSDKCNENNSMNESKEQKRYPQEESLTSMEEYFECEPNLSNISERASDSESLEEYFIPQTGSPQKDQLTDINTGITPIVENTSEEMRENNSSEINSEKETELRDDSEKPDLPENEKDLQHDTTEILLNFEIISENEKKHNSRRSEQEIEGQHDFAGILSNPKACMEKQPKCPFIEKERDHGYDTTEALSALEVISVEERQHISSEKTSDLHDNFAEIPSTSKTCLEKQRNNVLASLRATSEEDENFNISKKENYSEHIATEVAFTLENTSEKEHKRNLPIQELVLQYDDPSSTSNVKGFGNISKTFEWIKSSILTLAGNGVAEGSGDEQTNDKYIYSTDPEIDKIHRDIDEDFHKDLTSLFINASLEHKMIESAEKYGDPEENSPFDIEERAQWYLEELKNHLPPEIKELISNENKSWHRFSGDVDEFRNSNNIDESPHIKRLHEILKSRNAAPGVVDKDKALLKLVLANKDHLLNHEKREARELAKKILKDNGIEEPDTDAASIEVNLSNTSAEIVDEEFTI